MTFCPFDECLFFVSWLITYCITWSTEAAFPQNSKKRDNSCWMQDFVNFHYFIYIFRFRSPLHPLSKGEYCWLALTDKECHVFLSMFWVVHSEWALRMIALITLKECNPQQLPHLELLSKLINWRLDLSWLFTTNIKQILILCLPPALIPAEITNLRGSQRSDVSCSHQRPDRGQGSPTMAARQAPRSQDNCHSSGLTPRESCTKLRDYG